ncbi:MAG TPA: hypothetical protein VFS05_16760, partial [Gemmatimonadaceae bacterium]|nr:hypothetical protein [Gemmatimonadaceae bacterium]
AAASERGRPVAVALTAGPRRDVIPLARRTLRGAVLEDGEPDSLPWLDVLGARVDTAAAAAFVERWGAPRATREAEGVDPTPRVMRKMLGCPALALAAARAPERPGRALADSLDTWCNFR